MQTSISLPFITATADGPKHIETNLSRAKFEELASDLLDRCRIPVEQALKDANLAVSDINEVILVGGSTRIPAVQVLLLSWCSDFNYWNTGEVTTATEVLRWQASEAVGNCEHCHEVRHLGGGAWKFSSPLKFGSSITEWRV